MKRLEDHEITRRAARLAVEAGEPTTVRVLEEMLGVMHELEDRFPGVPFADLLADRATMSGKDIDRVRRTLVRNGACEADVALVCPPARDLDLQQRRRVMESDPYGMPRGRGSDSAHVGPDWARL